MSAKPPNAIPKRERRSRKSHKNLRDGCPNCRTKRIKCTEELPSCLNCLKKNLVCGYLTFPEEKLEVIRRKNELKRNLLEESEQSGSGPPLVVPMKQDSDGSVTPQSDKDRQTSRTGLDKIKKKHTAIKIRLRDDAKSALKAAKAVEQMQNLRSVTYQKAYKIVTSNTNGDLAAFKSWSTNEGIPFWDEPIDFHGSPHPETEQGPGACDYMNSLLKSPNFDDFSSVSGQGLESNSNSGSSLYAPKQGDSAPVNGGQSVVSYVQRTGSMLPNAIVRPTLFPVQEIPNHLQNKILKRTVAKVRQGNFDLKDVVNDIIVVMPKPVWSEQEVEEFWVWVFHQAAMLNLYFKYFIDKSVLILMRASDAVVNGDIEVVSLPLTFSGSLTPSESLDGKDSQLNFFYTKEDLYKLTCKSYVTYGRVIRAIRESINSYHDEYPAKISLFSALACYINTVPDYNTFCLMLHGTLLLVKNVLLNASSVHQISPALRQEILILNNFALAAKIPDFSFDVVRELANSFRKFQLILNTFINSYESGANLDPDLVKVLRDPIFRHDCHELNKFLFKIENFYYAKFVEINDHYKAMHNLPRDSNFKFVSPSLIFELGYEWLHIYPGDKMSQTSQNNPLKKTLYLFYHALAKCLAHVFTPTKSISVVDLCNVMFTKYGVKLSEFDPYRRPIYASIEPLAIEMVKIIKFFETRSQLYGYQLESCNLLNNEFIVSVESEAPTLWTHRDIVELKQAKEPVYEKQMSGFGKQYITVDNYPIFTNIQNDPTSIMIMQKEVDRQLYAIKNEPMHFNYVTGILNHDFDPTAVVSLFTKVRIREFQAQSLEDIEMLRKQNNELLRSRNVVKAAFCKVQQS